MHTIDGYDAIIRARVPASLFSGFKACASLQRVGVSELLRRLVAAEVERVAASPLYSEDDRRVVLSRMRQGDCEAARFERAMEELGAALRASEQEAAR